MCCTHRWAHCIFSNIPLHQWIHGWFAPYRRPKTHWLVQRYGRALYSIHMWMRTIISDLSCKGRRALSPFFSSCRSTTWPHSQVGINASSHHVFADLILLYADKVGRRPVILWGVVGIAITTTLFGLSKSLTMLLIVRAISGLCSGNTAVIHSVVGELTDPSNQAIALPLYGLVWPFGCILGWAILLYDLSVRWPLICPRPLLGGTFSHPATKFPKLFGYQFLRNYPYFLPCFISGLLSMIAVAAGYSFLEEVRCSALFLSSSPPNICSDTAE